jgi:hypothetical protein
MNDLARLNNKVAVISIGNTRCDGFPVIDGLLGLA